LPVGAGDATLRVDKADQATEAVFRRDDHERHGQGHQEENADEHATGRADDPQQGEEDDQQDERGAKVVTGHHEQAQHGGARHEGHQHVPPVGQLAQPVLAGEQVGSPDDQRQLGDLGRLDLLAAEGDPPGRAVLLDADPVDQGEAQPDDGQSEQWVGEGPEQPRRRTRGQPHERHADDGAEQLLLEVGIRRQASVQVGHRGGGLHHDQAEPEQQSRYAEDQVVGRERPVEQGAPHADLIPHAAEAPQGRPVRAGQLLVRLAVTIPRGRLFVQAHGRRMRVHDPSLFARQGQGRDIRRVSPAEFGRHGRPARWFHGVPPPEPAGYAADICAPGDVNMTTGTLAIASVISQSARDPTGLPSGPLGIAALISWVVTASIGGYMLRTWIARGGLRRQRATGVGVPPAVVFGHAGAALTGLTVWIIYLASGWDPVAWLAVLLVGTAISMGICMVTLWTPYPIRTDPNADGETALTVPGRFQDAVRPQAVPRERPAAPGERPAAPGERPVAPGERPAAPGERPDTFTVTDEMIAQLLSESAGAKKRRKLPLLPLIPACHGFAALATFLLTTLAALSVM
jgi:manganese efflux pump family protein